MKIVTWNVNSVKARHERLVAFLEREAPDVVCLQELKVVNEAFPFDDVRAAGYHAAVHGQKTYNGVAILSRTPPDEVVRGIPDDVDDPQARLIETRFGDLRVLGGYFPNGKTVGSDKYEYKLRWMDRLLAHLRSSADPTTPIVLCGDMNVAPDTRDVAFPEQWEDGVLCQDEVRTKFRHLLEWGLTDLYRQIHPEQNQYSWWDYRMLGFPKGNGLRIDHILASPPMASRCTDVRIDRDERKGKKPSDHAPVIATFD